MILIFEINKLILESGAAIDGRHFKNLTVLHVACKNNHHKIVEFILSYDRGIALINKNDNDFNVTPLTYAMQWDGDLSTIKLLISKGADKNIKGDNETLLEWDLEWAFFIY